MKIVTNNSEKKDNHIDENQNDNFQQNKNQKNNEKKNLGLKPDLQLNRNRKVGFLKRTKESLLSPFESREKFIWFLCIFIPFFFILYKGDVKQIIPHVLMYMFLIGYAHHYITGNKPKYNVVHGIGYSFALFFWILIGVSVFIILCKLFCLSDFIEAIDRQGILFYSIAFVFFCIASFMTPIILVVYARNLKFTEAINPKIVFTFIYKNFMPLLQNCITSVLIFILGALLTLTQGIVSSKICSLFIFIFLEFYYSFWIYFNMHINAMVMKDYKRL